MASQLIWSGRSKLSVTLAQCQAPHDSKGGSIASRNRHTLHAPVCLHRLTVKCKLKLISLNRNYPHCTWVRVVLLLCSCLFGIMWVVVCKRKFKPIKLFYFYELVRDTSSIELPKTTRDVYWRCYEILSSESCMSVRIRHHTLCKQAFGVLFIKVISQAQLRLSLIHI